MLQRAEVHLVLDLVLVLERSEACQAGPGKACTYSIGREPLRLECVSEALEERLIQGRPPPEP